MESFSIILFHVFLYYLAILLIKPGFSELLVTNDFTFLWELDLTLLFPNPCKEMLECKCSTGSGVSCVVKTRTGWEKSSFGAPKLPRSGLWDVKIRSGWRKTKLNIHFNPILLIHLYHYNKYCSNLHQTKLQTPPEWADPSGFCLLALCLCVPAGMVDSPVAERGLCLVDRVPVCGSLLPRVRHLDPVRVCWLHTSPGARCLRQQPPHRGEFWFSTLFSCN